MEQAWSYDYYTQWPTLEKVLSSQERKGQILELRKMEEKWHKVIMTNSMECDSTLTFLRNSSATIRARAFSEIFISLISLSISSMNCNHKAVVDRERERERDTHTHKRRGMKSTPMECLHLGSRE